MSDLYIGSTSLVCLFILLVLRVPIGLPMLIIGIVGAGVISGDWKGVWVSLSSSVYFTFASYTLAVLPLLILMGQFLKLAHTPASMYRVSTRFLGHFRGGVVFSALASTWGLSAICGTTRTTSSSLQPLLASELDSRKYSNRLKVLSLTATETLGVLMPPSILLVIYAILTEQEIGRMFIAAVAPLMLALVGYVLATAYIVRMTPDDAKPMARASWIERLSSLYNIWPIMLVFVLVVGGVCFEWFHPTEAAAVGAIGTALMALSTAGVTWASFKESLLGTAFQSARLYLLVVGAAFFNTFLMSTQLPQEFSVFVLLHDYSPWLVLILMLLTFIVFASSSDSLALILLIVPLFYPIVSNLELSESMTFNSGAMKALMPFLFMIGLRLVVLLIWPSIALQLGRMF